MNRQYSGDSFTEELYYLVDPDGQHSISECQNMVLYYLNEAKKKNNNIDAVQVRSAADVVNLLQMLPQNIDYTNSALVLGVIQILAAFALNLVGKLEEKQE